MFNLNLFKNIGVSLYLFIYLIIPYPAITQTLKVEFIRNLESSLNSKDLEFFKKNLRVFCGLKDIYRIKINLNKNKVI